MKTLRTLAAVAGALGPLAASATTYTIGTLPVTPAVYSNVVTLSANAGSFTDTFSFLFPAIGTTATGQIASIDFTPFNVDNLQLSLYTSANSLVATGGVGEMSSLSNIALTPGASYYYKVTGTVLGAGGGLYSFATAAAVPEPETYALMLAGVAAIGFVVMRRRD